MSGSAANASARRRRASNPEEESTNIQDNNKSEKKGISPLQILQAHEHRLKKLEEKKEILSCKDDNEKNVSVVTNDIASKIKSDLELLSNNNKLIEERTKNELTMLSEKIDILINENNSLKNEIIELKDIKLLVIKSQALGLETSKDVYDMKLELTNINKKIEDNENLENNKEQNLKNNEDNSGLELLKHLFMGKMDANDYNDDNDHNDDNDNDYDENDRLTDKINISNIINLNVDLTNEINDLTDNVDMNKLNIEDNELLNKLKDLTENINLIESEDKNIIHDIDKEEVQEQVINEIQEVLKEMKDSIDHEEEIKEMKEMNNRIDEDEEVLER
tara:strand:+ start:5825 stop:6826 length:1002 start_codon:yes stop_codon:yes gene_type:complete